MCERGCSLALKHIKIHKGMMMQTDCGCWVCPACGVDLRKKWFERAVRAMDNILLWEYSVCDPSQFQALTRRLRKRGRLYLRVRVGMINHVFHQPLLKTRQYTPDESKWLGSAVAKEIYRDVLWGKGVSRVSCSVALQTRKPKTRSNWKKVGVKSGRLSGINHFLNRLGIDQRVTHGVAFSETLLDVILLRDFSATLSEQKVKAAQTSTMPLSDPLILKGTETTKIAAGRFESEIHGPLTSESREEFGFADNETEPSEVSVTDEIEFSMLR